MKFNHIMTGTFTFVIGAVAFTLPLSNFASSNGYTHFDNPVSMSLNFLYHVEAEMAEQDVFIEHEKNSNVVYRATHADRNMNAPLYYPAQAVGHAPFDPKDIGPYPKGKPMGFTLGEWYAGKGQGSYTCKNGEGIINAKFSRLRPNAVYTMWHFFFANPPTKPSIGSYDIPMGTRDGAQSVFNTDGHGNAAIEKHIKPCLQLSGEHLASGLAIAWHSDGKTYGPLPGKFSINSHVQLFTVLPKRIGF